MPALSSPTATRRRLREQTDAEHIHSLSFSLPKSKQSRGLFAGARRYRRNSRRVHQRKKTVNAVFFHVLYFKFVKTSLYHPF